MLSGNRKVHFLVILVIQVFLCPQQVALLAVTLNVVFRFVFHLPLRALLTFGAEGSLYQSLNHIHTHTHTHTHMHTCSNRVIFPLCPLQIRLPSDISDEVDEDPTGNRAIWGRGLLNGASQKVRARCGGTPTPSMCTYLCLMCCSQLTLLHAPTYLGGVCGKWMYEFLMLK